MDERELLTLWMEHADYKGRVLEGRALVSVGRSAYVTTATRSELERFAEITGINMEISDGGGQDITYSVLWEANGLTAFSLED